MDIQDWMKQLVNELKDRLIKIGMNFEIKERIDNVKASQEFIQGNIKTDNFVDVWENRFKIFRTENRTKCSKCEKCSNWKYCLGDSFHTFNFDEGRPNFCIKDVYEDEID